MEAIRISEGKGRKGGRAVRPRKILVIDVGGSNAKFLATGRTAVRKFRSGPKLTPSCLVDKVRKMTKDWDYDAISLGIAGPVDENGATREPEHLGDGWVGFNFAEAFGKPVRVMNDAAMQALGSYEGGRMLFLGLGTALGSTFIVGGLILPLELGGLPYRDAKPLGAYLGKENRNRLGPEKWEQEVADVVAVLKDAFLADYVVLGGGNAKKLKHIPQGAKRGNNKHAFTGGFRLWNFALPPDHVAPKMSP